jgi:hypothetical protein
MSARRRKVVPPCHRAAANANDRISLTPAGELALQLHEQLAGVKAMRSAAARVFNADLEDLASARKVRS